MFYTIYMQRCTVPFLFFAVTFSCQDLSLSTQIILIDLLTESKVNKVQAKSLDL